MQETLMKLAEGCVDVHCTATNNRDAKREFSRIIKAAYDLGVRQAEIALTNALEDEKETKEKEKPAETPHPRRKEVQATTIPASTPTVDQKELLNNL